MTTPDDLTAREGLNEGSAETTREDGQTADDAGVGGSLAAATDDSGPQDEYDPSPPSELGLPSSETSADELAPGQELQEGEG